MSLLQNPKSVVKYIIAFVVLLVMAVAYATRAKAAELDMAYGKALVRGPTDVAAITVVWPNQIGKVDLFAGTMLIGSFNYENKPYSNNIVLRTGFTANVKNFGVTFGVADLQHGDRLNSGGINFNLGLSYRYKQLTASYLHISDGGTQQPNIGRDMVLLGWRFK